MLYFLNICIHTYIHSRLSNRFEIFNDFKISRITLKQLHFPIIFFSFFFFLHYSTILFSSLIYYKRKCIICWYMYIYRKLLLQFAGYQEIIDEKSESEKITKFEFLALDHTGIRNGISFMVFIISGYKKYRYVHNLRCR